MSPLRQLGQQVADRQDEALEHGRPDEALRHRLAERAAARPASSAWRARRWALVLALACVGGVALLSRSRQPVAPLTFSVGQPARPGVLREWVSAPAERAVLVRFSDGTRMTLESGGRGRVLRVGPEGAELVLESGRALVDVVPRADGDWQVRTGPFVVHVHGTRFTVSWDPSKDAFALALHEGTVTVSGCTFGEGRRVRAGEEVHASCASERARVAAAAPVAASPTHDEPAVSAPAVASPSPRLVQALRTARDTGQDLEPGTSSVDFPTPLQRPNSWTDLARAGHYRQAYDLASMAGFEREAATREASDVLLLGDAARLSGQPASAELAYRVVRERFAGSPPAATAAFALGRLAADVRGDARAASGFLRTYLRELPDGSLAAAALGRLLEAQVSLGEGTEARSLARSYLERYPGGPHAEAARKIAGVVGAER